MGSPTVAAAGYGYHHPVTRRSRREWQSRALAALRAWGLRCLDVDDRTGYDNLGLTFINWHEGAPVTIDEFCREADEADCAQQRAQGCCVNPGWAYRQQPLPFDD